MRNTAFWAFGFLVMGHAGGAASLQVQAKITLPDCQGRIDHLAFDAEHGRLFVAELGNDSVAVVDITRNRLEHRIAGLDEPQGIAYFAPLNRLYVAGGGDGSLRAY